MYLTSRHWYNCLSNTIYLHNILLFYFCSPLFSSYNLCKHINTHHASINTVTGNMCMWYRIRTTSTHLLVWTMYERSSPETRFRCVHVHFLYIRDIYTSTDSSSKFWLYKLWPSIHRIQTILCTKKLLCSINTTKYMSVIEINVQAFDIDIRSNSSSYKFNCSVVVTISIL